MTTALTRAIAAVALAAVVTACATVDAAPDVADVRDAVSERRAGGAAFDADAPAEDAVSARVRALVADPLTADRAVEVAFLRNRRLQGVLAEIGIARAELVQAGLLRNPILTASVRFGIGASGTGAELGLVQELLNVLQIPLKKRVAAAHLEATKLAAGSALLALAADVRAAFYEAQAAEQQLALRRTVAQAAEIGADLARRRHAAGNATDLDRATEEALFEDARLSVALAEIDALERRETLTALLGLFGAETAFAIGERLPALPERDRELAGLESLAVERRLDLAAARQEIAAAEHEAAFARFYGLVPDGGLGAAAEREVEGGWSVGPALELELPLFDQRQAEVATARAKARREAEAFAALAVAIRSEVRIAHARLAAARARVQHYERTVLPLRATILDETLREHNAMQVGPAALLLAKTAQVEAGTRYVGALADYWSARARARPRRRSGASARRTGGEAMISRREVLVGAATAMAGAALAGAQRSRAEVSPAPAGEAEPAIARAPSVVVPNGSTLPWKLVDGVKVFHLIAEPVEHEFAPGLRRQVLGLQRPTPGPDDRGRRGRPRAHLRHEPAARADDGALARRPPAQRHGRRRRPHPDADPARRDVQVRVHAPPARHVHVPPALRRDDADRLGMMGMFIVHPREPRGPARRPRLRAHAHEWPSTPGTRRPDPNAMTDFNVLTFNSKAFPGTAPLVVEAGERVRIRLGNLGAMDHHPIHLHGHAFDVTATDGGPIPESARWSRRPRCSCRSARTRDDRVRRRRARRLGAPLPHDPSRDEPDGPRPPEHARRRRRDARRRR